MKGPSVNVFTLSYTNKNQMKKMKVFKGAHDIVTHDLRINIYCTMFWLCLLHLKLQIQVGLVRDNPKTIG